MRLQNQNTKWKSSESRIQEHSENMKPSDLIKSAASVRLHWGIQYIWAMLLFVQRPDIPQRQSCPCAQGSVRCQSLTFQSVSVHWWTRDAQAREQGWAALWKQAHIHFTFPRYSDTTATQCEWVDGGGQQGQWGTGSKTGLFHAYRQAITEYKSIYIKKTITQDMNSCVATISIN